MSKTCKKIEEIKKAFQGHEVNLEDLSIKELKNLTKEFKKMTDERYQAYVIHRIENIIMIVLMAVLSNANEWGKIKRFLEKKKKWLKKFLKLDKGIPSIKTIRRVLMIIKPVELYQISINYFIKKIEEFSPKNENEVDIVSLDGKVSKGSARKKTTKDKVKPFQTMSAYSSHYGLSLYHDYIKTKKNEIPLGPELIKQLNAPNCIFTWDALNTQIKTVKAVSKSADYVAAVKGNQPTLHEEIIAYFNNPISLEKLKKHNNYKKTVKKEHNAIITREYFMTDDCNGLSKKKKWKRLNSIGVEKKTIEKLDGKVSHENRYFITSLSNDIELFSYAIRAHWGVENNLHAPLDIVFREDKNKTLEKNGAKALGVIRRVALIILRLVQPYYKKSLPDIRYDLSLDFENEIKNLFKVLDFKSLKEQLNNFE